MSVPYELATTRRIVTGAGLLLVLTFVWAGWYVYWKGEENSEIALPIVIIAGVISLLVVLGLLTFQFSVLNLTNKDEALGLPSGSVRAVIALMLLVIFAIVAIFIYRDVARSKVQRIENVSEFALAELRKNVAIVAFEPMKSAKAESPPTPAPTPATKSGAATKDQKAEPPAANESREPPPSKEAAPPKGPNGQKGPPGTKGPAATKAPANTKGGATETTPAVQPTTITPPPSATPAPAAPVATKEDVKYIVYYIEGVSAQGTDIAKQLIVLLGTLVTAVSSFYFGANAVSSAQEAVTKALRGDAGPNVTGVTPPTLNPDGTSQTLTITGVNLQRITTVELVSGDKGRTTRIQADPASLKASSTTVTCTVSISKETPPGAYDVEASDNTNNKSITRITIATPPKPKPEPGPGPGPGHAPEIKSIEESALIADGKERAVKVTGSNLADVEQVKFNPADGIKVGKVVPGGADALTFTVTIASAVPPKRQVTVSGKAGESKPVEVTLKSS